MFETNYTWNQYAVCQLHLQKKGGGGKNPEDQHGYSPDLVYISVTAALMCVCVGSSAQLYHEELHVTTTTIKILTCTPPPSCYPFLATLTGSPDPKP